MQPIAPGLHLRVKIYQNNKMNSTMLAKPFHKIAAVFFICSVLFSSCINDKCETTRTYVKYTPVIKNLAEIRDFKVMPAKNLEAFGKIWIYGKYLLVNEPKKGIHIFDNTNPSSPQALSFISIPGNVDMAVRDNMLYADNYIDLLVINIANPQSPTLEKRIENSFQFYDMGNTSGLVVDYTEETVTEVVKDMDCNSPGGGVIMEDRAMAADNSGSFGAPTASGGGTPSRGGSMARFTLYKNYLYIIADESTLKTYDISSPANPLKRQDCQMSWGMETLFPYKDNLFVGASGGMFIYSLSNPARPAMVTQFRHANACDPVVVENDIAYITLRNGTRCNSFSNQLDVVDVKDIYNPVLLKSYPMHNPHGLGIDNSTLFLCDGSDGLKVFDATDVYKIDEKMLGHYTNLDTYDVIPNENTLILTSKSGIYQYDYSDPKNLKLLSRIAI
ncbi:MAG: hypothetical protein EOP53_03265 [Sphingobacteriales bacterium]|nr:MAG: hypothetical protein EOP53_03265 [Sphingobacteriales bacterium]